MAGYLRSILLLSVLLASSASAVTMAWTPIGNPGNACNPQSDAFGTGCYGRVDYAYEIGTYEVKSGQYAEFLNAKAASDPYGLYNPTMGFGPNSMITRSGSDGSYTYQAFVPSENYPAWAITFYDALRFANWMNNGQGSGDTETGAYTLLGGTPTPSNGEAVTRNAGATIVLPNENEWYKAAFYDSSSRSFFAYPTASNSPPTCMNGSFGSISPNLANCNRSDNTTPAGIYTASPSPYGTFDQGGNVWEWDETIDGPYRQLRGGSWASPTQQLAARYRFTYEPSSEDITIGFRLAMIPEPTTGLLVIAGLLGLAGRRRVRA